jgi:hypothetical protein
MMEGVGRRLNTSSGFLLNVGSHSLNGREHNVLFRNNGDGVFSEVGWVNGADRIEDGRGLAVFDADHDGRLDIVLRNFHQSAGLLRNRRGSGHWVGFELEGTRSNRDAVGARVRVRTGARWQTRVVTSGSGYLSGSSLRQHFGLGNATRVDEVVIDWPSGGRTELRDLEVDRLHRVSENYTPTSSRSTQLTGPERSPTSSSATVPGRRNTIRSSSGSAAPR